MPRFTRRHFIFLCITVVALITLFKCATRFADAQSSVTAESIQRWRVNNGFYTLTVFGDGTLLAAGNTFASGAGTGVKLNPHDGTTIGDFPVPDVRTSVRLSTGDQDYVVGGYGDRVAVRADGSFGRYLIGLGCCNIPRYPLALDPSNNHVYAQANGELFGADMTNGAQTNHFYGAIDTFGMISIADSNTLYTAGQNGNAIRLDPINGHQWHVQIDNVRLQPGAVAADGSFVVTSGPAHLENSPQPGRLARVAPDGTIAWNNAVNAVTPPVISSNNLVFVGTQAPPVDENGAGAIEAYDLATGALVWRTDVQGLPNDLLVGDDGAVYAGTGKLRQRSALHARTERRRAPADRHRHTRRMGDRPARRSHLRRRRRDHSAAGRSNQLRSELPLARPLPRQPTQRQPPVSPPHRPARRWPDAHPDGHAHPDAHAADYLRRQLDRRRRRQ
jgi:hypothetical protein